jgi:ABC-type Mn2+/Zn2+ transport system permease subunit
VPQELHDVSDILFGNAIAIERGQMISSVVLGGLVLAVLAQLARPLLVVAFDPVSSAAHGVAVRGLDAILFACMGLAVAAATKVVGALPAFAFAVFPAAAALRLFHDARLVTGAAALFGAASAFFGYWASFAWSAPTGACMAAASIVGYGALLPLSRLRARKDRTLEDRSGDAHGVAP